MFISLCKTYWQRFFYAENVTIMKYIRGGGGGRMSKWLKISRNSLQDPARSIPGTVLTMRLSSFLQRQSPRKCSISHIVSYHQVWMWSSQRSPALYRSHLNRSCVIIILLSGLHKNAFRNCFAECFYILNILKKHQELLQNLISCNGLLIYRQEKREWVPKTVRIIGLQLLLIITATETSSPGSAGNSCQGEFLVCFPTCAFLDFFVVVVVVNHWQQSDSAPLSKIYPQADRVLGKRTKVRKPSHSFACWWVQK